MIKQASRQIDLTKKFSYKNFHKLLERQDGLSKLTQRISLCCVSSKQAGSKSLNEKRKNVHAGIRGILNLGLLVREHSILLLTCNL